MHPIGFMLSYFSKEINGRVTRNSSNKPLFFLLSRLVKIGSPPHTLKNDYNKDQMISFIVPNIMDYLLLSFQLCHKLYFSSLGDFIFANKI